MADSEKAANLRPGQEVEILGGMFAGRRGIVQGRLASGKLRVRVKTFRAWANAKVVPADLQPVDPAADRETGESPL